jgi:hypothetical protein
MNELLQAEFTRLSSLSFEEVQALPHFKKEDVVTAEGTFTLQWYHDTLPSGDHLVAIQAWRDGPLRLFNWVDAEGFVIGADGTKRPLTQEEKTELT